jgi:hypothetical protein
MLDFMKCCGSLSQGEPSAEFRDYEQRLASIKKTLISADKSMTESTRLWTQQLLDQRSFSAVMLEGHPSNNDITHDLAKSFSEGAKESYDHFIRDTSPEMVEFHRLHNEVRSFIDEIHGVEAMYPALKSAKGKEDHYESKVGHIVTGKKAMEGSKEKWKKKNLQELDKKHNAYQAMCDNVVAAQKDTHAKAATVYRMALCSYWYTNAHHLAVANESLERTKTWSERVREELKNVTVANLDVNKVPSVEAVASEITPVQQTINITGSPRVKKGVTT